MTTINPAFYAAGIILPGPTSAANATGQIPVWNESGFDSWIGTWDLTTLTLPAALKLAYDATNHVTFTVGSDGSLLVGPSNTSGVITIGYPGQIVMATAFAGGWGTISLPNNRYLFGTNAAGTATAALIGRDTDNKVKIDGSGNGTKISAVLECDNALNHIDIGGLAAATELRFLEPSGGGTSYVSFIAPALAGNVSFTLPAADGSTGQFLKTDGSGVLSFATISGGGDALVANPLSQFAATTSSQLAGVISDETGSGVLVFATSPTLVTPVLGVASATSINKVAITAPATSATLTIADGKTLAASNTITFTATDGSTLAIGGGGTLGTAAYTAATAYQSVDATLTALAGLTIAANSLTIGTGADAFSQTTFAANTFPARASTGDLAAKAITDAALTVLDDTTVSAMVDTLGGASATGTGGLARATSPTFVTPLLGTPTSGVLTNCTGTASGLTAGTCTTIPSLSGDVTSSSNAVTIANDAVTYAKIQNVTATDKVLGRSSSGAGDVEELACTAFGRIYFSQGAELTATISVNATTLALASGVNHLLDFAASASGTVTITFSGAVTGIKYLLRIKQGATGRAITWADAASMKWDSVGEPTWASDTSKDRLVTVYYNGTNYFMAASETYA